MKIVERLARSVAEKDVENIWRAFLSKEYRTKTHECQITSPYRIDGYFEFEDARVLCEFKDNIDMQDNHSVFGVVAQSLYYLKKFQEDGQPVPNVIFAGDRNECFVLGTGCLLSYLQRPYDWSIAPSLAGKQVQLLADLINDDSVIPVVFNLDSRFSFDPVRLCIQNTSVQAKSDTPITAQNIVRVFEYWVGNVLRDSGKMDAKDVMETFLTLISQPQDCYLHPKKQQFLMIGDKEVRVKPKMFKAFFTQYKETHNPRELREITASKDRLFEEVHRRRTGAFFTPSIWVDEVHKMIAEQFGDDWKEKYVVWDCSCGTLNLTRDYRFKELYCSTLDQADLDLAIARGYNPEAVKFQFDFLNDEEDKLPEGLKRALAENRPILFFNNPPYGTANDFGATGTSKAKITTTTVINALMKRDKIGACSQQLYAQFLYRMFLLVKDHNLTNVGLNAFTVPGFLSYGTFELFRKVFFDVFKYHDGMLFQASNFADVSETWGISFTVFSA